MEKGNLRQQIERALEEERNNLFQYASYRFIELADVEDVLQDLYVTLLSKFASLSGIANLKGYIYRTLSNCCTSRQRHQRNDEVYINDLSGFDVADMSPESFEDEFRLINALLARLSPEQSETIRLKLDCGLTFEQIAEITEVPLPTAKSRFRYGIDKLRNELKKYNLF